MWKFEGNMNYYDRIQKSIEFIENNLDDYIDIQDAAGIAKICPDEYCRFFHAVTGYSVVQYVGLRKISSAVQDMQKGNTDISKLAKKYCFSSTEAFSMVFRSTVGYLPSEFLDQDKEYSFKEIDVRKMYIAKQDEKLLEQFPDIYLLKPMPKMRLATYTVYGTAPENEACEGIMEYTEMNNRKRSSYPFRIFGFSVPDSIKGDGTYGYTVCITVGQDHVFGEGPIEELNVGNGLYAVTTTTVDNILKTWKRFNEWLKVGGYCKSEDQYFEEHLLCRAWREEEPFNDIEINLYMPVKKHKCE